MQVDKGLQWGMQYKSHLGRLRHIQAYSYKFKTMCDPGIFSMSTYSEPVVYSENPVKHLWWSILWKHLIATIIFANYNCLNISFPCPLVYKINMNFLNTGLIFTPEVFIPCKKVWESRRPNAGCLEFDIPWNFVKEHMLHNFTKYRSGAQVNQSKLRFEQWICRF